MFVDNLPHNLDKYGLKGIFQRIGFVSDSYIPAKLGRTRKRFGFIRFVKEIDAKNSVMRFNGRIIRGCRVRVNIARHGKGNMGVNVEEALKQKLKVVPRRRWGEKNSQVDQVMYNQKNPEVVAKLSGETNESFVDWLNRSIISTSSVSWDLDDLSQALAKVGCEKVRAFSKCKFILTFQTGVQRDEVFQNQGLLVKWFHEVKNWDIYEACDSRRLWIEVFGVPPHGWSLKNFEIIASIWGELICLETTIDDTICFSSMRILIKSKCFQEVVGHIILQIGDASYRIMVKEASCSINLNPVFITSDSGIHNVNRKMEVGPRQPVNHKEEVVLQGNANQVVSANSEGVESVSSSPAKARITIHGEGELGCLGNEVAVGADVERCLEVEQAMEEGDESPCIQISSNLYREDERLSAGPGANSHAYSRTPTICFSHNYFPEEVTRTPYKLGALNGSKGGHSKSQEVDALGTEEALSQQSNESQRFPPGFEPRLTLNVQCTEFSRLVKLDDITKVKGSSARKGGTSKKHMVCLGKRVTRSQSRMCKQLTRSKKSMRKRRGSDSEGKEDNPSDSTSVKTTKSMRKVAVESLSRVSCLG